MVRHTCKHCTRPASHRRTGGGARDVEQLPWSPGHSAPFGAGAPHKQRALGGVVALPAAGCQRGGIAHAQPLLTLHARRSEYGARRWSLQPSRHGAWTQAHHQPPPPCKRAPGTCCCAAQSQASCSTCKASARQLLRNHDRECTCPHVTTTGQQTASRLLLLACTWLWAGCQLWLRGRSAHHISHLPL